MTRDEELEFQIAQYAVGTLDAPARDAVERELRRSADARDVLASDQRLTALLRADAVPAIDFDALARRVQTATMAMPVPRKGGVFGAVLSPMRLTLAASVLIAAGIAIPLLSRAQSGPTTPSQPTGSVVAVQPTPIDIRAVDPTRQAATETIAAGAGAPSSEGVAIGPSPEVAGDRQLPRLADGSTTRPARVDVASPE